MGDKDKITLEELFKDYNGDYVPTEINWGEDVGTEVLDQE